MDDMSIQLHVCVVAQVIERTHAIVALCNVTFVRQVERVGLT